MAEREPVNERLRLNPISCEGVGICGHLAADLIRADSWGYPIVDDAVLEGRTARQARAAIRACPHKALYVD